ncbi:MAG: hypothetical protein ACFFBP_04020 [Promethearchaeota archaeon]
MVIREIGLLLYGMPIFYQPYNKVSSEESSLITRSAFISSILGFAEKLISPVDYFESEKYIFVFQKDFILSKRTKDKELLIAYTILDQERNVDKSIRNRILPILQEVLKKFISLYNGRDLNETSQFNSFKKELDKILGTDAKSLDEKVSTMFFGK